MTHSRSICVYSAEYEVRWSSGNQFAFNEEDRLRKCV